MLIALDPAMKTLTACVVTRRGAAALGVWLAMGLPVAAQTAAPPVAGLAPDERPEGAPRITTLAVDNALKQQRLHGISLPWPGNVERIAEQGAWYSPMFRPGLTGRYDLRGLHPAALR